MDKLITYIDQIISLSETEKDLIRATFNQKSLKAKELWMKEGAICHQIAFISSGRFRAYYTTGSGKEVTIYFGEEGSFISSYTSFLTQTPSLECVEAINASELLIINKKSLEDLCIIVPKIHILFRIIAENLFINLEKRTRNLLNQKAEERYEKMMKENPEIILNVPLQYTASFLGITPQHLSRLRKNIK
ncbi:Crp/Fnr family transcriptional regulator [Chryseobacterium rhizosphaerae]|uniref:Crp/Fnr family transcriptional regulator n=1 Tax=Chryseobacterium rhizosphaerae TaxID=395937 RepID=UPI002358AC44|nr:Crp/Fnr family transcriptional regulator [Chryseobacterium rhizosphaerae]MDC8101036.1 Crp/Fnr family transcriptional regulator [Chryseobacterium rhizosphaerae]